MPVEIVPATGTGAEFEAALTLKRWFRAFAHEEDTVTIVVGAKTEGEVVEDIDLLVIGEFGAGRMLPDAALPEKLRGRAFEIRDFVFTIEIKSHDASDIRLSLGNKVDVQYDRRWKSATDQALDQKYALKNWIEKHLEIGAPRISHAVWLKNVRSDALKKRPRHVLFSDSELTDMFAMMDASMFERVAPQGGPTVITSIVGRDRGNVSQLRAYFQKSIQLGALDRRKLERICERIIREQNYVEKIGQQMLIFRGRGGAGKTLRLLNLTSYLCRERHARVLFLTYNKSLVQDVRRLISVLGFSEAQAQIQTTDSYLLALCTLMGAAPKRDGRAIDWADFAARKQEVAERFSGMTPDEVMALKAQAGGADVFNWDFLLIDEGQDWPVAERAAVLSLFGHRRIIVADGVDQFVQSASHSDWAAGLPTSERQIVTLPKSLRLKANLCRFAIGFAREMGLHEWNIDLDPDIPGGKVRLFLRPFREADQRDLGERLSRAGNAPIDTLYCISTSHNSAHRGFPAQMEGWGLKVWDGTVSQNRSHYPVGLDQHRAVQYRSCRGLEGWTVVCLDFDCFFDEQVRHAPKTESADLLIDAAAQARRHAARWCLIPFTRAIDTLVVHAAEESEMGQVLLRLAKAYPDFVEIVR